MISEDLIEKIQTDQNKSDVENNYLNVIKILEQKTDKK